MKDYKTVLQTFETEIQIKKSLFIARISSAENENYALDMLSAAASSDPKATHICYAYILKTKGANREKFSDAGEPQGTAGKPILSVLNHNELTNVILTVTRYFGGIKLGAAGLVRAYMQSAESVIQKAQIVIRKYCIKSDILCSYSDYGKLKNYASEKDIPISGIEFAQDVHMGLLIPYSYYDKISREISEITNGRVTAKKRCAEYVTFMENTKT